MKVKQELMVLSLLVMGDRRRLSLTALMNITLELERFPVKRNHAGIETVAKVEMIYSINRNQKLTTCVR